MRSVIKNTPGLGILKHRVDLLHKPAFILDNAVFVCNICYEVCQAFIVITVFKRCNVRTWTACRFPGADECFAGGHGLVIDILVILFVTREKILNFSVMLIAQGNEFCSSWNIQAL